MKKYLLGFFAIIFAIALVSFTQESNKQVVNGKTTYSYKFIGSEVTEDQLENTQNWSTTISGCSGSNLPCRVDVADQATISAFVQFLSNEPSSVEYVDENTISLRN